MKPGALLIDFRAGCLRRPITEHHHRWDRGKYEKKRLEGICTPQDVCQAGDEPKANALERLFGRGI